MFWAGETLEKNIDNLFFDEAGNSIGDKNKIDCAAYTLTIGPEIFITPSKPSEAPVGHTKIKLDPNQDFQIPQGQFVFIITEEFVKIPADAIAFISLKTKNLKFKGLINVSGFHVDPGYHGRLVFSVFNAGPVNITLNRGQDFALIWLASLDQKSKKIKKGFYNSEISTSITGPMSGELFSPVVIKERLKQVESKVDQKFIELENSMNHKFEKYKNWAIRATILFTLFTLVNFFFGTLSEMVKKLYFHSMETKQEKKDEEKVVIIKFDNSNLKEAVSQSQIKVRVKNH